MNTVRSKSHAGLIAALWLVLASAPTAHAEPRADLSPEVAAPLEESARATVDEALTELLAALADASQTEALREQAVETIVRNRLDFPLFAQFSLAKNRTRFSKAQLDRYTCAFDPYLSHYIGSRLIRYQQEKVNITGARALRNRDVNVDTQILGGSYDRAIVTFRMRQNGATWRVIDVAFEGIKVLKVLRAEFDAVIQRDGPDEFIATLQEKTPGPDTCGSTS